ncbi:MAG: Uma2 family endonuclease [Caldilineaceae bacterium]
MQAQILINPQFIPVEEKLISGEEALELGIDAPFELVRGKIVYMDHTGDEHGNQEAEIAWHLINFNRKRKIGWVLSGEVGVYTQFDPDTVRAVDVIFISRQRLPVLSGKAIKVAPELVIEIISPTDRWRDVRDKIEEYFAIGVDWVWIVEPANKSILLFRTPTDMVKLTQTDTLQGEGILEGFTLPLAELFADL